MTRPTQARPTPIPGTLPEIDLALAHAVKRHRAARAARNPDAEVVWGAAVNKLLDARIRVARPIDAA